MLGDPSSYAGTLVMLAGAVPLTRLSYARFMLVYACYAFTRYMLYDGHGLLLAGVSSFLRYTFCSVAALPCNALRALRVTALCLGAVPLTRVYACYAWGPFLLRVYLTHVMLVYACYVFTRYTLYDGYGLLPAGVRSPFFLTVFRCCSRSYTSLPPCMPACMQLRVARCNRACSYLRCGEGQRARQPWASSA